MKSTCGYKDPNLDIPLDPTKEPKPLTWAAVFAIAALCVAGVTYRVVFNGPALDEVFFDVDLDGSSQMDTPTDEQTHPEECKALETRTKPMSPCP